MTKQRHPVSTGTEAVAVGEVFPPAPLTTSDTKAGSTGDLKALHADLTATYRDYLEMAKIKPSMLSPAMLGLIQTFLRHNEITAEVPQRAEVDAMQRRLEQKKAAREKDPNYRRLVMLNQTKKD